MRSPFAASLQSAGTAACCHGKFHALASVAVSLNQLHPGIDWFLMSDMSTNRQIKITVTPHYLQEQSEPENNQYIFAYTVHMENQGDTAAQLLTRHWIITDSEGKTEEVRGPGVVGEHPHLKPGESFEYTSGAILQTPVGAMMGSYQMRDENGDLFDAVIPAFTLSAQVVFH